MLHIVTWRWGTKYPQHYVDRLQAGVARGLRQEYRFIVATPTAEDTSLIEIKGCFARLRMFDPAWQQKNDIAEGDRAVCIDLDLIITGALDALFDRSEPFVILQGANAANPNPYNGSVWMVRAGYRPDVWTNFSLAEASQVPFYAFPDDQAWMAHTMPGAAGWKVGPDSGVYAFGKPKWSTDDSLPADARLVAFPGYRDPAQFTHLPWVQQHWRA